jgi:hypothetical protein
MGPDLFLAGALGMAAPAKIEASKRSQSLNSPKDSSRGSRNM